MNDYLIVYIEKDIARMIDNESIMQQFQNMKHRRRQLQNFMFFFFFFKFLLFQVLYNLCFLLTPLNKNPEAAPIYDQTFPLLKKITYDQIFKLHYLYMGPEFDKTWNYCVLKLGVKFWHVP